MRGAVCFERPHFHFSETLPAELRLASKRLLGNERVRTDGARVDLVIHQVRQLQHVDVADGDFLLEGLAGHAVVKAGLSGSGQVRLREHVLNLGFGRSVEDGRREPHAERVSSPAQVGFEDLADVHSRRHAKRIQNDFGRRPIRQIRHVFFGKNPGDHSLVAVAACHLVANRELALHRDVNLHEFDHARRQLIAATQLGDSLFVDLPQDVDLPRGHLFDFLDLVMRVRSILELQLEQFAQREVLDDFARHAGSFRHDLAPGAFVNELVRSGLAFQESNKAFVALVCENPDFVAEVFLQPGDFHILDQLCAFVFLGALAGKDLHVDDDAFDARRADQGCVADIAGLLAEDGAKKFFFRRKLRLALRRDLSDEHVAGLHIRTDADDAGFVQVFQERLADVRNIPRDFFRTELRIARFDLEFLDVDRRVVVVLHQALGNQNRVFKVVAAPRHEGDKHVAPQSELALLRAGAVGQHLAFRDPVSLADDRLLVDAGVLIRSLEFRERIDVRAHFT